MMMLVGHDHTVAGHIYLGNNTDYLLHLVDATVYVYKI